MLSARCSSGVRGVGATWGFIAAFSVPFGCGGHSEPPPEPVDTSPGMDEPGGMAGGSTGAAQPVQPVGSEGCDDAYSCACGLGEAGTLDDGSRFCVGIRFCNADSECAAPNDGSVAPACFPNGDNVVPGAYGHCILPCAGTSICPSGMECGGGRCVFVTMRSTEAPQPIPMQGPVPDNTNPTPVDMDPSPEPVEPTIPSTHGSGGPVGPAHLTSKGGLSYEIDAPSSDHPRGLLILLHGSTASNYENFIRLMRTAASEYDLIPVSVLAPNGQGWNEGNQVAAAELLHRLVQEDLYTQYDVDTRRVLFSGQSSGGGFLASNFVPAHAHDYQGGAFLQCGAAPPNIPFMPSAETRQRFRLHFEITTDDPIWPEYYAAAIDAYTGAQMQLSMDNTKPGGHCQFDQQQVILDHIDFVLGSASASAQ